MSASLTHSSRRRRTLALRRIVVLGGALLALGAIPAAALSVPALPLPQLQVPPLPNLLPAQLCLIKLVGEKCVLGLGMHDHECVGCVSHADWPNITGIRRQVIAEGVIGHTIVGSPFNDLLLGRHGSDRIVGGLGDDVLWADSQHNNNNTKQRDVLLGGPGNDWLYASHGYNRISGGPGNDQITAYYGHGVINCGPGRDTVTILHRTHHYRLRHCEIVKHQGDK